MFVAYLPYMLLLFICLSSFLRSLPVPIFRIHFVYAAIAKHHYAILGRLHFLSLSNVMISDSYTQLTGFLTDGSIHFKAEHNVSSTGRIIDWVCPDFFDAIQPRSIHRSVVLLLCIFFLSYIFLHTPQSTVDYYCV